jgi:nicotinamide-nucleotide amidase
MSPVRGELILIGESLEETGTDFFTPLLRGTLLDMGIRLAAKGVVPSDEEEVSGLLRDALGRSQVVVVVGRMDQEDGELIRKVLAKLTQRRLVLAESSESGGRQILIPSGALLVPDPDGNFPGLLLEAEGRWVVALPHPLSQAEFSLLRTLPLLAERGRFVAGRGVLLRTCGRGIETIRERIKGVTLPLGATLLLHSALGGGDIEVLAQNREDRLAMESPLRERLQADLYGICGETLEGVVAGLFRASGKRLAVAESCTGGRIAERLTRIPGSSTYFDRGLVTYSNRSKLEILGLDGALLTRHGAVSRQAAIAMAEGAKKFSGTDIGLSATGIAGPDGGSDQKPVGLVYIGLCGSWGTSCWRHRFPGDREAVRAQAAQMALDHLRRRMQGWTETESGSDAG